MNKLFNNFKSIINILLLIFLVIILFGSITNINGLSFLSNVNANYMIIINIIFAILFIISINIFNSKFKDNDRLLKIVKYSSFFILIFFQIILIYNFNVKQMTDSYWILDQANAIVNNVSSKIDYSFSAYFSTYNNNNFYLVLTIYLIKFFKLIKVSNILVGFFVFNTIMIDLSIVLLYLLTKKIADKKIATLALVFSCLNPLNYFMIFWAYTCPYSLPFVVGLIYLSLIIKDCNNKYLNILYGVLFGFILIICYMLRPIIIIPLFAIIICLMLKDNPVKDKLKKYILPTCFILFSCLITYIFLNKSIDKYTEKKDTYFPSTHWIMMGLHGDGTYSTSDYNYTTKYKTTDKMKKANINEIKKTLYKYKLSGLIDHSIKKIFVTWADGSSGYYGRLQQDMNENNKLNMYLIGSKRDLIVVFCNVYRIAMILLTILFLIDEYKNKKDNYFMLKLTLFGAIMFYLLWEAKDVYSYPFLFLFTIFASVKMNNINTKSITKISKKTYIIFSIAILTIIFGLKYNLTSKKNDINKSFLIIQNESANGQIKNVISDNIKISQEFELDNKFNSIDIKANKIDNNDNEYKIILYKDDEKKNEYIVNSKDIKNGFITLKVKSEETGKGKYLIEIQSASSDKKDDNIGWIYIRALSIDNYKGDFVISDEKNNGDLYIRVYKKYSGRYLKSIYFYIIYIFIILILYIQYKNLYTKKIKVKKKQKRRYK